MSDLDKTIDELHDIYQQGSDNWLNGELTLRALKALAIRVEALEKRHQETAKRLDELEKRCGLFEYPVPQPAASGGPKREPRLVPEPLTHNPEGTTCGLCLGTHEHYHSRLKCLDCGESGISSLHRHKCKPETADLWSSCALTPCVHCHELTVTSFNAVPMHRSCAAPDAGRRERRKFSSYRRPRTDEWCAILDAIGSTTGNPEELCEWIQRHKQQQPPPLTGHAGDCTIYAFYASENGRTFDGICTCGYGWQQWRTGDCTHMYSKERDPEFVPAPVEPEQQEHGESGYDAWMQWSDANPNGSRLDAFYGGRDSALQHPAQWREARDLERQWRAEADRLNRDFPRYPKCEERAECLRHCADQLAALLPPEKEKP